MESLTKLQAVMVLNDCRRAFKLLVNLTDKDNDWRVLWAANIALLRAVGHVLENVDSKKSLIHKQVIGEYWPIIKDSYIFKHFIKHERNNILKEYKMSPSEYEGGYLLLEDGGHLLLEDGSKLRLEEELIFTNGPLKGKEGKSLIMEAIGWWEGILDEIIKSISMKS